jgi:hypothetical protein
MTTCWAALGVLSVTPFLLFSLSLNSIGVNYLRLANFSFVDRLVDEEAFVVLGCLP